MAGLVAAIHVLPPHSGVRVHARDERGHDREADRIRAELDAMGILLKDSKDLNTGELVTTWEGKR
jgi:cysteinyl-tRNA synthetase